MTVKLERCGSWSSYTLHYRYNKWR